MYSGVKQGRRSSMRLFCDGVSWGIKELVDSWRKRSLGFKIGEHLWNHVAFADDFTLLASSAAQAHQM
eukprot:12028954-Karenia_brevis.AAC.1